MTPRLMTVLFSAFIFVGAVSVPLWHDVTYSPYTRHHDVTASALISIGAGAPTLDCCGSFCGQGLDAANEVLGVAVEIPSEWDGVSNMTLRLSTVAEDGDPFATTEDAILGAAWRSVVPGSEAGDVGSTATDSDSYTQSGAGTACATHVFELSIPYAAGNQPLAVGDDLGLRINRVIGSESNSYSGYLIIYKAELEYTATGKATH